MRNLGARYLAGIGVCLALGFAIVINSIPALAGVVDFSDPGLEAAIRDAISKPTGDILDTDLLELTHLDARYFNIANLDGIERLINLRELDLYGNQIVDIAPLSGLTNLTDLILTRNQISDISPLSTLPNLIALQLRNNQIQDIRPLIDNPAFACDANLALSYTPQPIQPGPPEMLGIDILQGRGVNIFFAPVVYFPDEGLEEAVREAIGKPTEDILDIDLIGLTSLTARYQGIANLEGIEHCVNLTELDLYGNNLADIRALSELTKLTKLSLEANEIVDISPLAGLTNLTMLYLDSNDIIDISPLANLTNLVMLFLWENQIVDLSPLSSLANLTGLYLHLNRIVDISPLAELTQITGLGLSWNQIEDISPLSSLTNLKILYADNNQIVDIAPLVTNIGIARDDIVRLQGNPLFPETDSKTMLNIGALLNRGVDIDIERQD